MSASGTVTDVNVKNINITHTWVADVKLVLRSPSGTEVVLADALGGNGDNYTNTNFDDQAASSIASSTPPFTGTFKPFFPLSAFNGQTAAGTWQLRISDSTTGDTGTLLSWSLQLTTQTYNCNVVAPTAANDWSLYE